MSIIILFAAAAAAQAPQSGAGEAIVVTGSREPVRLEDSPVSATVIEEETLEALALPATNDILRLVPGVSVSINGPRGTQTQIRIRGGETRHSLLYVDGIRFNDPAADNFARFELLTNDSLSRVEVVRGPQSALWGSEALGGVVAVETAHPLQASGASAIAEYGSLDSGRASVQAAGAVGPLGVSGFAGWLKSDGIDSFGSGGERDGFENRAASLKSVYAPLPALEFGLVGHWVEGESEYDDTDPVTFKRADTLHSTDNRIAAIRAWASVALPAWSAKLGGTYLDSVNRNRLGSNRLNSTFGRRFTVDGQLSRSFGGHRLTVAAEHQAEDFRARDQIYFGATDQDRSRTLTAFVGQWRADWSKRFVTDVAVRRDDFSAFADATTVRAIVSFRPTEAWTLHAGYGEGIAQPTFNHLYGFFPGSFVGNPDLRPERSKGWEAGLRWTGGNGRIGATAFSSRLEDEIVGTFDSATFLSSTDNVEGKSPRRGVELDGQYRWRGLILDANYTFLDAKERRSIGAAGIREVRRPRHSANVFATGSIGPVTIGTSLAYVGERSDTDFDTFQAVTLDDYLLASVTVSHRLASEVEIYARAENLFDADYQDVFGYNTAGRTIYAGLRLHFGR